MSKQDLFTIIFIYSLILLISSSRSFLASYFKGFAYRPTYRSTPGHPATNLRKTAIGSVTRSKAEKGSEA